MYSDDVRDLKIVSVPSGAQLDGNVMKFMKDSLNGRYNYRCQVDAQVRIKLRKIFVAVGDTLKFSYEIFADASLPNNTNTYRNISLQYGSIKPNEQIFDAVILSCFHLFKADEINSMLLNLVSLNNIRSHIGIRVL